MLFGALVMSTAPQLGKWIQESTSFGYAPVVVSGWLRGLMFGMAVLVLYSGMLDLTAMMRLVQRETLRLCRRTPEV
jgi:hypothetical protein